MVTNMWEWWAQYGYAWVVLPLAIFLARIIDVSIATLRLMFLSRGSRLPTVLLGFFESLIWIIIVSQVIRNLDNALCFIAYAGGFASGSYIGMWIEGRLALGKVVMRVITQRPADELLGNLRERRFGVTSVPANGAKGPVQILFMIIKRSDLNEVIQLVKQYNPNAFYTIEDVRYVSEGVFPAATAEPAFSLHWTSRWRSRQK